MDGHGMIGYHDGSANILEIIAQFNSSISFRELMPKKARDIFTRSERNVFKENLWLPIASYD